MGWFKSFTRFAKKYGKPAARRVWELSRDAARDFIKTLRRLQKQITDGNFSAL